MRNYATILVTLERIQHNRIKKEDYEFHDSMGKITKVKNKKEGLYIEYIAIDEKGRKIKKTNQI